MEQVKVNMGKKSRRLGGRLLFFFSSRRRHTRLQGDWSSDVCSSDLKSATLIDHVYSNRPSVLTKSDTIDCSLSDHDIL